MLEHILLAYAQKGGIVVPIEFRSGAIGRTKSLQIFIDKYNVPFGIKISQARYDPANRIISLPLYAIESFFKWAKV